MFCSCIFLFPDAAPTHIYTLPLHDALPICIRRKGASAVRDPWGKSLALSSRTPAELTSFLDDPRARVRDQVLARTGDRKSTRLNSSHVAISYAVFCLKKKKNRIKNNSIF